MGSEMSVSRETLSSVAPENARACGHTVFASTVFDLAVIPHVLER